MYWYLKALKQYANFKGKASRKEFWMFFLFHCLIIFLVFRFSNSFTSIISFEDSPVWMQTTLIGITVLLTVYLFGTIVPFAAITVRRLRDAGRSGIWFYFPFAVTVCFTVARYFMDIQQWMIGYVIFIILFGIILFIFLLQKSVENENEQTPNNVNQCGC